MPNMSSADKPRTIPPLAAALAWILPGAGHWYLGRRVRAVILFLAIHGLFWAGVGVGGVFTMNPREELWWSRAQFCTGASGVISWLRQDRTYAEVVKDAIPSGARLTVEQRADAIGAELARRDLALVPPGGDIALVFSGVAGMLNLMAAFDALMLSLMGRYGEPDQSPRREVPA